MPKLDVIRSIDIQAEPQRVFDTVADFQTWTTWSPWLCADKEANVTVSENANGVGAIYEWQGQVVGAGAIEHQSLDAPKSIVQELRFTKPHKSTCQVRFELEPTDSGTRLSWTMDGSLPWFLFWMTGQMKAFIGADYERGLKMLKEHIETGAIRSDVDVQGVQAVDALQLIGKRVECSIDEIGPAMSKALDEVKGPPRGDSLGECVSVYHKFDFQSRRCEFTAGFRSSGGAVPAGLVEYSAPAGQALATRHTGSYDHLGNAWSAANQHLRYKKLKSSRKSHPYEVYRNTPDDTDAANLVTDIYLPLK